jgi:ubiquitin carboxyl-terminal hydrolase 7
MTVISPTSDDMEMEPNAEVAPAVPQSIDEDLESMEVVPVADSGEPGVVTTVANQPLDDSPEGRFTWQIDDFSLKGEFSPAKLYSRPFVVGGYKWRILIFPRGNSVDSLSIYLDVFDAQSLPPGWSRAAYFSLLVVNQHDRTLSQKKDAQHVFNAKESDWGFTSFMPLTDLMDPSKGFVVDDKLIVEADVQVRIDF